MEVEACAGCTLNLNDFILLRNDSSKLREFLIKHEVVPGSRNCPACGSSMTFSESTNVYHCRKRYHTINSERKRVSIQCDTAVSLYSDTLFQNCYHEQIRMMCYFIALWIQLSPREDLIACEFKMIRETIDSLFHCMWNVCLHSLSSNIKTVGGPGKTVEIYEAKVFHRKCTCGKIVNGNWVFGFLERGSHNCFAVTVKTNGPEMLLPIIEKYVMSGTKLVSDCWRNYKCLKSHGYPQLRVNSSLKFVHPERGEDCRRGILYIWDQVRSADELSRFGNSEKLLHYHIVEFLFRYRHPVYLETTHNIFTAIGKSYSKCDALITSAEDKDCSSMSISE